MRLCWTLAPRSASPGLPLPHIHSQHWEWEVSIHEHFVQRILRQSGSSEHPALMLRWPYRPICCVKHVHLSMAELQTCKNPRITFLVNNFVFQLIMCPRQKEMIRGDLPFYLLQEGNKQMVNASNSYKTCRYERLFCYNERRGKSWK